MTGADINPPSFQNVDLTPGLQSSGAALAGMYNKLGLGDSTMLTQDENANLMKWDTQEAELNNQLAQQTFQDQLAAAQQNPTGGFLSGLLGGGLGGLL